MLRRKSISDFYLASDKVIRMIQRVLLTVLIGAAGLIAQESKDLPTRVEPNVSVAADKVRVFVGQSNDSWSFTASRNFAQAGTHPQTVELMKSFGESCPNVIVTDNREKADYKVIFERESNKGLRKHNKFAAFNRTGDMVYSTSTRSVGSAVRGFCDSITPVTVLAETTLPAPSSPTPAERQLTRPKFLHNSDVLALKEAGFSDEIILQRIKSSSGLYEIETADLVKLKTAGISQEVIEAMLVAPDHK